MRPKPLQRLHSGQSGGDSGVSRAAVPGRPASLSVPAAPSKDDEELREKVTGWLLHCTNGHKGQLQIANTKSK